MIMMYKGMCEWGNCKRNPAYMSEPNGQWFCKKHAIKMLRADPPYNEDGEEFDLYHLKKGFDYEEFWDCAKHKNWTEYEQLEKVNWRDLVK